MKLHLFRTPSVDLCLALIAGIVTGRYLGATPQSAALLLLPAAALVRFSSMPVRFRSFIVLFSLVGFVSVINAEQVFDPPDHVTKFAHSEKTDLSGTVQTPIDYYPDGYRFHLAARSLTQGDTSRTVEGRAVVNAYFGGTPPLPGDEVTLRNVRLRPIRSFRNVGGFDYERYMKNGGIGVRTAVAKPSQLTVRTQGAWVRPDRWGEQIRRNVAGYINRHFPRETAPVASAMVVGVTGGVDGDTRRRFVVSGLAHLLAVSGLHVGFVSGATWFAVYVLLFAGFILLRPRLAQSGFMKQPSAILALLAGFLFVLSTGSRVSAKRAGIMVGIYLLSALAGREKEILNALALSAIIVLLLNPTSLFSASFILSYVAVLAIIFLFGYGEEAEPDPLEKLEPPSRLAPVTTFFVASAKISVGVGVATAPVAMAYFHEVHFGGLLANLLAVPMAAVAVPSTLVAALVNALSPTAGNVAAHLPVAAFGGIDYVTRLLSRTDYLSFTGPPLPWYVVILYYATLLAWFFRSRLRLWATPLLLAVLAVCYYPYPREATKVYFFDVGQGESTLIAQKSGTNVLVDGGTLAGRLDIGQYVLVPALHRLGIRKLDAVIATHGDSDHVGGFITVLKRIKVDRFYDNGQPNHNEMLTLARETARQHGVAVSVLREGMTVPLGDNSLLRVLHPDERFIAQNPEANDNEFSLAMMLESDGVKILLSGDIERAAEQHLVDTGVSLKADFLKVPHHGSRSSSTVGFLKEVSPKAALIGVGTHNPYRHPSVVVMRRFQKMEIPVYATKDEGQMILTLREGKTSLATFQNPTLRLF